MQLSGECYVCEYLNFTPVPMCADRLLHSSFVVFYFVFVL